MKTTCDYKLGGTKSFRRASKQLLVKKFILNGKTVSKGYGSNIQNIEKGAREMYHPDGFSPSLTEKCQFWLKTGDTDVFTEEELSKLRCFAQCDQAGAEALIVAYLCEPGDYRQLFIHNVKPHVYVAMKLFKDVWTRKLKQSGGLIEDFNIEDLCSLSISQLKLNPFWKDLDSLIKSSDNWPLTERYYYLAKQTVHCVDKDTEVLTKNGWTSISNVDIATEIAISDGYITKFEKPLVMNEFDYSGEMLYFVGEEIDQYVTPEHKMVYSSNNKQHIAFAKDVIKLNRPNIPTSTSYIGGEVNLKDWEVKLLVAIQADGYIEPSGRLRFKFSKDRKIDRLLSILTEANIKYEYNPYVDETSGGNIVGDIRFYANDITKWFGGIKQWNSWLLKFSKNNLELLISELKFWDGTSTFSYRNKREEYCSFVESNIDWIKTICHLVNKQGTKSKDGHKLGINNRTKSIASSNSKWQFTGKVYCPTVSTGIFLVRRKGKISLTHNSANYGIMAPTFRMNILDKSGGKIVISKEDSEKFLLVYRSLFPEIPDWNEQIKRTVQMTRMLFNLHGHPYTITDYHLEDSTMKEYIAWVPQSTVGEITRIAFSALQEYIEQEKKPWDILQDNHDSYMQQFPLTHVRDAVKKQQEYMNQKLQSPVDGAIFYMKSEVNIGFNWGSQKQSNPLGLQSPSWL